MTEGYSGGGWTAGSEYDKKITGMIDELLKLKGLPEEVLQSCFSSFDARESLPAVVGLSAASFPHSAKTLITSHEEEHKHDWLETGKTTYCLLCGKTVLTDELKQQQEENKKMESHNNETVVLGATGPIELPKFDPSPYVGKRVKIEKIEEKRGVNGYYIRILTEVVAKIGDSEVRASKILGLQQDKDGKVGWDWNTKTGVYLKKWNVKHYNELIGKEVMLQSQMGSDGRDYLTFN